MRRFAADWPPFRHTGQLWTKSWRCCSCVLSRSVHRHAGMVFHVYAIPCDVLEHELLPVGHCNQGFNVMRLSSRQGFNGAHERLLWRQLLLVRLALGRLRLLHGF